MLVKTFKRIPKHIGIIPDGNRRWAQKNGFKKQDGYSFGVEPGYDVYRLCLDLGVKEITFYGFTIDNTKRASEQIKAFQKACIDAVEAVANKDADILVIGNTKSPLFPKELSFYTERKKFGKSLIKINFLVNYGWDWDLNRPSKETYFNLNGNIIKGIASSPISMMDLIIRWGGMRRLSGFLPIQSVYADFYIVDEMWPDYSQEQFYKALDWYQNQDITRGG